MREPLRRRGKQAFVKWTAELRLGKATTRNSPLTDQSVDYSCCRLCRVSVWDTSAYSSLFRSPPPTPFTPGCLPHPRPRRPGRTAQQPTRKQGGSFGPRRKNRPATRSAPRCTGWRPRSRAPGSRAAKPPASRPARQSASYGEGGRAGSPKAEPRAGCDRRPASQPGSLH